VKTKEDEILAGDPRHADTHGTRIDADAAPGTIEKQIDAKRADINRTLNALEERFSPGQMVDQTMGLFRDNGGEMAQNLGRQVRDNPLPFLLTGVGLVWAMMASSSPRGGSSMGHYRSRYGYDGDYRGRDLDERYDQDGRDRAYGAVGDGGSDFTPRYTAGAVPSTTGSFASDGQTEEDDEGLLAKARERFGEMGDRLSGAADDLSENVAGMSDDARRAYEDRKADMRRRRAQWDRGVRDGMDSARGYGASARDYGRDAGRRMRRGAGSLSDDVSGFVQEQPMVVGAIGVAVGALIGALLPASEVEDRYLGDHADEAKRVAREQGESGMERVREEADRLRQEAEGGLDQLRDKVEDVAGTARSKAEEAAGQARAVAEDRIDEADRKASPENRKKADTSSV